MLSHRTKFYSILSRAAILLMVTGAVLPIVSLDIAIAQPAIIQPSNGEGQPYLVLVTQRGAYNIAEQNSTVSAFGRNYCSAEGCSAVTLTIGNKLVANQTIGNVTVLNQGTFATNFTVKVPFTSVYTVTAAQKTPNGIISASTAINVPVSDPTEGKEDLRGEPLPQHAANITFNPNALSPFNRSVIPVSAVSDFNPNIPNGGRAVSVDVSPTNSAVAIVASETGGLWKTTNSGAKWSHLSGGLPITDMSDVKFAPENDHIIITTGFANSGVTHGGGIWRSNDGGTTWTKPPTADPTPGPNCPDRFSAYGISFAPGTKDVFVGTSCGVAASHDLGLSWTHVVPGPASVNNAVFGINAQRGHDGSGSIVDTCGSTGHHRSTDSGTHWSATSALPACAPNNSNTIKGSPFESDVLFAVCCSETSSTVYESDDGGNHWTKQYPVQTCGGCRGLFVATAPSPDGIYGHFDVYATTVRPARQTCTNTAGAGTHIGGTTLRCDPKNWSPNPLAWKNTDFVVDHDDVNGAAFSKSTVDVNCLSSETKWYASAYVISDGGIHTSTDCGAHWHFTGGGVSGYHALQVYEITGQVHPEHTDLYFGTQDNDLWASGDNGVKWTSHVASEGFYIQMPHSSDTDSGQAITATTCAGCRNFISSAHFASTDAWNNPPGGGGYPFLLEPNVYIQWSVPSGSSSSQLFIKTGVDGKWTAVAGASTPYGLMGRPFIAGDPSDPVIYQGVVRPGDKPGLIKITGLYEDTSTTTNADSGLNKIGTFPTMLMPWPPVLAVDPNNPDHLLVADAGKKKMMVSKDGGASWSPDESLTDLVTNFGQFDFTTSCDNQFCYTQATNIGFDPNNGHRVLVGTHQAGIFESSNGGASWNVLPGSNVIPHVSSFFFDEVQNKVIASSYGRGLWTLNFPNIDYCSSFPDICDLIFTIIEKHVPSPGPICLSCINFDINGLKLNESVLLTPSNGSVMVTRAPTG